jgi:hypothetical protein
MQPVGRTIEQIIEENSNFIRLRLAELNVHTPELNAMLAAYVQSMRIRFSEAKHTT